MNHLVEQIFADIDDFRGDKQKSSEGNGLGLAIVSTYVKALGGEFDIKIDCDQFKACVEIPRERRKRELE